MLFKSSTKETLSAFIGQINGRSSHDINALDNAKGRGIWYNYWDTCPRSEQELYSFFNYIHVNPLKHRKVYISSDVISIQGDKWKLTEDRMFDFHKVLASYQYSSYPFYLRKYGESGLTNIWMDYPILVNISGQE